MPYLRRLAHSGNKHDSNVMARTRMAIGSTSGQRGPTPLKLVRFTIPTSVGPSAPAVANRASAPAVANKASAPAVANKASAPAVANKASAPAGRERYLRVCTTRSKTFIESEEDTACEVCEATDDDALMVLCDKCNCGYHIYCLVPPLREVPTGDFFCPSCKKAPESQRKRKTKEVDNSDEGTDTEIDSTQTGKIELHVRVDRVLIADGALIRERKSVTEACDNILRCDRGDISAVERLQGPDFQVNYLRQTDVVQHYQMSRSPE